MNRLARAGLLLTGLALPALPLLAQHAGHGDHAASKAADPIAAATNGVSQSVPIAGLV